jgi:hypothetical protein
MNGIDSSQKNYKWLKLHEEMCNIFIHKGNANQSDTKIPSHPNQNGYHQENKQQMLVGKKRNFILFY